MYNYVGKGHDCDELLNIKNLVFPFNERMIRRDRRIVKRSVKKN